jgi:hypothetical protein
VGEEIVHITRNGPTREADQLAAESAMAQRELEHVRRDPRTALLGLLKKQWNHDLDPDALREQSNRPLKDVLAELFPEQAV